MEENKNIIAKQALSVVNSSFSFSNYFCDVLIDTIHDNTGNQYKNLRIKNISGKHIDFNFTQALYKKTDSIQEHNILMEFISIPNDDANSLTKFFINNGFILHNSVEEYVLYSCTDLHAIVKRVKCLVELIMELQKGSLLNEILLKNTIYLLLSDPIIISNDTNSKEKHTLQDATIIYNSGKRTIHSCIFDYNTLGPDPHVLLDYDQDLHADAYMDFENSKKEFKDELKFSLTLNYLFRHNISPETRAQISFLYKLVNISGIDQINTKEGVVFTKKIQTIINAFDDELKSRLTNIAKHVIKTELDFNISRIRPSYNTDTLLGSWKIPDLLSAIYFSIFFLNPNFEIIKKCANSTCPNYYSVLHSNKRKKYCSQQCANAVNQRKSRARRQSKTIQSD
ncbi:CGNR zinc finger domain-containing protein [Clostridium butyricum]|uniref:CGNR zinc finger domain-containing protein n=1 Tax=Clostridium TaxID=1485 RepID=UPI00225B039E|nr:CGNR zinc finger domain-containing protein [Clostridium sp. LQ25]UZT08393.1 CGNR zinc finger domain-containing protein [Clostridium sp. LQ25]